MTHTSIVVSGVDGSGKTTLAKWLVRYAESKGCHARYVWIRYHHTLAYALLVFVTKMVAADAAPEELEIHIDGHPAAARLFSSRLWTVIELVSVLPHVLFRIRLPMLLGYLVVCDRCTIDTAISIAVRSGDTRFPWGRLGTVLLGLVPKESLVLFLDADRRTVLLRRPDVEFSEEQVETMLTLYRNLVGRRSDLVIDVSSHSLEDVKRMTLSFIGQKRVQSNSQIH